jgi:hypothetical protein
MNLKFNLQSEICNRQFQGSSMVPSMVHGPHRAMRFAVFQPARQKTLEDESGIGEGVYHPCHLRTKADILGSCLSIKRPCSMR